MKIAFIIFDGTTWLDFIGIYEPLTRLKSVDYIPDLTWDICAFEERNTDIHGLQIMPSIIKSDLSIYDAIIVPGGLGTRKLINDEEFLNWIRTATKVRYKISVCTGSLILGAAGFLKNVKATTHFDEYPLLNQYCKEVVKDKIVEDSDVITAGAVSSSIDLGLYLCEKWVNTEAKFAIAKRMDYKI
ncbi:MAG: DJ-1/PfpI family protein [Bacteroidota bacterium]